MAELNQYLRIGFAGLDFLLPSEASHAIEQRHGMIINDSGDGSATAWWESRGARWPVYHLDRDLELVHDDNWQRAVFLNARPHPVGLAANEIQLLSRSEIQVEPFYPLGKPATAGGHLFSAAWVKGAEAMLIFEPDALTAYLLNIGARA